MEFSRLALSRRSVRQFTQEPIRQSTLEAILTAGLAAPSPNNSIPWHICVITNGEVIQEMKQVVNDKLDLMFPNVNDDKEQTLSKIKLFSSIFANAPVVLAILSKDYVSPICELVENTNLSSEEIEEMRRHPKLQATGALVQNIMLAATEEDIGSCWVSGALVARKELEKIIKAKDMRLETLIALGQIENQPHAKEPIELDRYVNYIP